MASFSLHLVATVDIRPGILRGFAFSFIFQSFHIALTGFGSGSPVISVPHATPTGTRMWSVKECHFAIFIKRPPNR